MHTETFDVRTLDHEAMIDITERVAEVVAKADVSDGITTIYVPHTTAGVTINENADPNVVHDMLKALDLVAPWRQDFYRHNEGNSAAHVKSSMIGCSVTVPIIGARLVLGTWQAIYFCEFDGPRNRRCLVTVT